MCPFQTGVYEDVDLADGLGRWNQSGESDLRVVLIGRMCIEEGWGSKGNHDINDVTDN